MMKQLPPEPLRGFPPLSNRCAIREGGRSRRPHVGILAALAREPWRWPRASLMHPGSCLRTMDHLELVRKLFDATQRSFRDGMQGAVRGP